jgi:hypothetical protein
MTEICTLLSPIVPNSPRSRPNNTSGRRHQPKQNLSHTTQSDYTLLAYDLSSSLPRRESVVCISSRSVTRYSTRTFCQYNCATGMYSTPPEGYSGSQLLNTGYARGLEGFALDARHAAYGMHSWDAVQVDSLPADQCNTCRTECPHNGFTLGAACDGSGTNDRVCTACMLHREHSVSDAAAARFPSRGSPSFSSKTTCAWTCAPPYRKIGGVEFYTPTAAWWEGDCVRDCVGSWDSDWGSCQFDSGSCGTGKKYKQYNVITPQDGGSPCIIPDAVGSKFGTSGLCMDTSQKPAQ